MMWREFGVGMCVLAGIGGPGAAWGAVTDSFNDNVRDPMWSLLTDSPTELSLVEQNGRLEAIANAPVSSATDALYLSNGTAGFRLATTSDFQVAVGYQFPGYTSATPGAMMALVFGVGRDLDGTDSAAIGLGRVNIGPGASAATTSYRIDDVSADGPVDLFAPTSGTFVISYLAATDSLTFGIEGRAPFSPLVGIVRGEWEAESLLVSLGARGNGYTLTSGQAYFDDFEVRSGTIVPEPASIAVLLAGGLALRRRRLSCRAQRFGA